MTQTPLLRVAGRKVPVTREAFRGLVQAEAYRLWQEREVDRRHHNIGQASYALRREGVIVPTEEQLKERAYFLGQNSSEANARQDWHDAEESVGMNFIIAD